MTNVTLKLNSPTPGEVAIKLDKPWESETMYDPVVMKDDSLYRMWYRTNFDYEPFYTGYAESDDGIHYPWSSENCLAVAKRSQIILFLDKRAFMRYKNL